MDTKPRMLMEITNTTTTTLKSVEILTVFLKDEQGSSAPSQAHIRFDPIKSVQPKKAVVSHRTWINGRPANDAQDQIGRLEVVVRRGLSPTSSIFHGKTRKDPVSENSGWSLVRKPFMAL